MNQQPHDSTDTENMVPRAGNGSQQSSIRPERAQAMRDTDVYRRPNSAARWGALGPVRRRPRGLFATRWRWMVLVTLLVVGAAALLSWSRTPTYRASADVLVQPRIFSAGTPPQVPDMGSEKATASSSLVLDIAARAEGISIQRLGQGLSVSVPLNTHVLHISYSSANADLARQRAQAVATAYVSYWLEQQPPLGRTSTQPTRSQILDTAVITPAKRPSAPASPNHVVDVGIALIIGLVLAFGTAYLRDRLDDRLRGPEEFETTAGAPLLAVLSASRRRADPVVARQRDSAGGEAYRELRTLLLRIIEQRGAKSLVVTAPTGDAQTVVSANLAVTLAQTGRRVVLVHADVRRPHGHELFGVDPVPGIADVLEGRASLTKVLRQPEIPGPQIVAAGLLMGDIGATLHTSRLGEAVRRLAMAADIVVIDAPAVLEGSDIASMVEVADMVLLVGDARHTTRAHLRAAAEQLAHVHEKLIGGVLTNSALRSRVVTPPLSMITGRRAHGNASAAHSNADSGNHDRDENGSESESSQWLLHELGDSPVSPSDSVEQANGWDSPAATRKG
jgi:polysaccharide biosynthesis transport protein